MIPKCEKCGSQEFESRWQGLSFESRCTRCHWGAVTTRFPPMLGDKGPYQIIVTSLGIHPQRTLIAINQKFDHGIRRTRELFSAGEQTIFTGDAYTVWQEAQRLRAEQVPFRIEPEYPFDLATYDPHHSYEHDWLPTKPCLWVKF
jgi:hypothetical protein